MKHVLPSTIQLDVRSMNTDAKRKREGEGEGDDEQRALEKKRLEMLAEIKQLKLDTMRSNEFWTFDLGRVMEEMIDKLDNLSVDYRDLLEMEFAPIISTWERMATMVYEKNNDTEAAAVKFTIAVRDFLVDFINSSFYNGDVAYIKPGLYDGGAGAKGVYGVFVQKIELLSLRDIGLVRDE